MTPHLHVSEKNGSVQKSEVSRQAVSKPASQRRLSLTTLDSKAFSKADSQSVSRSVGQSVSMVYQLASQPTNQEG